MNKRSATIRRKTRETAVTVALGLDGAGACAIETGLPFLNHMLELLGRHALLDLRVKASGDTDVDYHHLVEDIGLTMGAALNKALGARKGISRYGWAVAPMDDALSRAAVDLGGRPYLVYRVANRRRRILNFDLKLLEEFFRALATEARMNLHIENMYGDEPHHAYESVFKAAARALRMACARDPREKGVPSSKGRI
ncbi:MAG: imidazoleglycerol-phosphate dehydratase HisB [Lentisphaerae bacterium]|nr:imidazoleglycerol-phosphate dehydratase HisB [Lentisphaerota bacterium]